MLPDSLPEKNLTWEKPEFKAIEDYSRIISGLAELDPIEYDRIRERQAKNMGIRVSTLDSQVLKIRPYETDSDDSSLVEELQPWEDPVHIESLLNSVHGLLSRHVVLPQGAATGLTLWVAGTFVYDSFRIWPKLTITSPEKRCGKTTLLEVLASTCNRSLVASNISPAAIYRAIEACKPSLLIDEADTFLGNNDELRGVINSGHTKRSAFVVRVTGDNHEPAKFSTWCPMVISMIKMPPDTILDRSIIIQLRRKIPGESAQKIPLTLSDECKTIRRKLTRWALDSDRELKGINPSLPACNNDRALDNWTPLFAIAEQAGDKWVDKVTNSFNILTDTGEDTESIGPMILNDIRSIFKDKNLIKVFTSDLVNYLVAMEDRPWCEWRHGKPLTANSLSRLLKPFKIHPATIRLGATTKKGFHKKSFRDAFSRYLCPDPPFQTVTPSQPSNHTGYSDFQTVTLPSSVTVEKTLQPSNHAGCDGVTVEIPPSGEETQDNPDLEPF